MQKRTNQQVPGELFHIARTADERVIGRRSFYRGRAHVDVRIYRPTARGGWKPTRSGITVPVGVVAQLGRELERVASEPPPPLAA